MAKVMVSIPDDLLARLDERARTRGTTRSGLLRDLVERDLANDREARGRRVGELLGAPRVYDGRGAEHVRADRTR